MTMHTHGNKKEYLWNGFAASVPGCGHIRYGIPCQDASAVILTPRPTAIVCDGRGSAKLSHFGAQEAVKAFRQQTSILEPFLVNILDGEAEKPEQWTKFCRIMYRTLMQVKYNLAEEFHEEEKEFDCTVAFAITGKKRIGCFQVGDGSIVLRQNGICKTVFLPEKGEFANQTHFLRPGGEDKLKFQYALLDAGANSGIAITSDGPEFLMFHLTDMTPGAIFGMFLDDLRHEELRKQDLMDYLTRREWSNDPRGDDDRSLALLAPIRCESSVVPEPKMSITEGRSEYFDESAEVGEHASISGKTESPIAATDDAQKEVTASSNASESPKDPDADESAEEGGAPVESEKDAAEKTADKPEIPSESGSVSSKAVAESLKSSAESGAEASEMTALKSESLICFNKKAIFRPMITIAGGFAIVIAVEMACLVHLSTKVDRLQKDIRKLEENAGDMMTTRRKSDEFAAHHFREMEDLLISDAYL